MIKNVPHAVVMVRPINFGFNIETAANNAFQSNINDLTPEQIHNNAIAEFDTMVELLSNEGIEVIVFDGTDERTPDCIFPNNWFSTFTNEVLLYPMFSANRRLERKEEIFNELSEQLGKPVNQQLLYLEKSNEILEGTGSLVCDYNSKTAFAAISPRTTNTALDLFEEVSGYSSVRFKSYGPDKNLIYHTNVMLTMGDEFAVIGLDTIDTEDRDIVEDKLKDLGKEIIELSNEQVYEHFAGNMLQVANNNGDTFLIMSATAKNSLTDLQTTQLERYNSKIIAPDITTIETIGGGSARCMMAEIFY